MTSSTTKLKPVSFAPQKTFAVDKNPLSVAVADVNGDGNADVITANSNYNGTVSILLGDGRGDFATQTTFAVGTYPTSVSVADVNGDGNVDVVTSNQSSHVSVLVGDGRGNFATQKTFAVGDYPNSVSVGDVNGDGNTDVVTANYNYNGTVSILLGDGRGDFAAQTTFATSSYPYLVSVADVNGDGNADVVTANIGTNDNWNGTVSVLAGDGLGNFAAPTTFAVGRYPYSVSVVDVNGDGNRDVITANVADNSISVLIGDGRGNFAAQITFAVGSQPTSVSVADVNGDGKLDVVTANSLPDSTISVLVGDGRGNFETQTTFAAGSAPNSLGMTDVDGDGKLDIVTANLSSTVSVLLNTTGGIFAAPSEPDVKPVSPVIEDSTPTYALSVDRKTANEGDTVTFKLTTTNVAEGSEVSFNFNGTISDADALGDLPIPSFFVESDGTASVAIGFKNDKLTEGNETLTLTLNDDTTQSASVTIKDTSIAPKVVTKPTQTTSTVKIDGITKTAKSNAKDLLIGTEKNDSLTGLAGADTLRGNAGNDVLNGGLGNDSIEGGNGNDTLNGGDGNDKLIAGSGDDKLDGGKDNDTLDGGAGKDTLIGGAGVDSMTGGDGDDFYFVDNVKDKVVEINTNPSTGGKDTVTSNSATYTLGENIENLILEDLQGKGTSGAGNKGNNVITGSIGDNKLEGLAGNDTLIAGDGADTLDGGLGMDSLVGGNGDDLYMMNNIDDLIDEKPDGGIDHIIAAVTFNLGQSENVEYLTLSGKNAIEGTGNNLDNLIQEKAGGTTNNSMSGGEGNDTLNGEGGNDTLNGGDGDDELNGGDGNDVAIFTGEYLDYLITTNIDAQGVAQLIVEYKNSETGILDGTDTLNDIEILEFASGVQYNKADVLKDIGEIETDSSAALILTGVEIA